MYIVKHMFILSIVQKVLLLVDGNNVEISRFTYRFHITLPYFQITWAILASETLSMR